MDKSDWIKEYIHIYYYANSHWYCSPDQEECNEKAEEAYEKYHDMSPQDAHEEYLSDIGGDI